MRDQGARKLVNVLMDQINNAANGTPVSVPCEIRGDYKIVMDAKSDVVISNGNLADKLRITTDTTTYNGISISSTPDGFSISGTTSFNTYVRLDGTLLGSSSGSALGSKNYTIPANGSYKICLYATSMSVAGGSPSINIRKSDGSGNLIQLLLANGVNQIYSSDFSYVDAAVGALYLYIPSGCTITYAAKIALVPTISTNYTSYVAPSNQIVNVKTYSGSVTDAYFLSSGTGKVYALVTDKLIRVTKTGQDLTIYVPCKATRNYIRYDYKRIDNAGTNMHQWRVQQTYLTDASYNTIFAFDDDTEWEGAIWELGAADFIGGYHGDETNLTLNVLIDNIPYSISGSDFTVYAKNEVRIVNTSVLNRCNTPNDNVFNRFRVNVWTKDNYIVENKYIALQNFHIKQAKISLLSCKYNYVDGNAVTREIVTNARTDHDYAITDMSTAFTSTGVGAKFTDTTRMEIWGNTSGVYARLDCTCDQKYANRNYYVEDFRSENRCKLYFDVTGDYSMVIGEVLTNKSIISLNG